jgi:hypothetical protein
MSAKRGQGNTLWIAIGIAAVLLVLAVWAVTKVRLPKPADVQTSKPATGVSIARTDGVGANTAVQQQAELTDPMPLFMPTASNSSDPDLPARLRREPGDAFQSFPARYAFDEYDMKKVAFPEPIDVPNDPQQALYVGKSPNPFFTFGRESYRLSPLSPRLAFLEVAQAKSGLTVLAAPLKAGPADNLPSVDWQPLEMMVAVESTGLVGGVSVTSGSGYEEVDDFFRAFIAKQFRLGARLPPGFYMLRIGP